MTTRRGVRRAESTLAGSVTSDEIVEVRNKSAPGNGRAQLSVDSDDENPDPEILAQFLERKTDFSTPLAQQRETLWREKTRSLKRVNALLFTNGDLLNPEAAQEDSDSIKEDIQSYLSLHDDVSVHQSEELTGVGQWFSSKQDEAKKDQPFIDSEDLKLDASLRDVGQWVSTMGSLRGKMSFAAEKLLSRMAEIIKNDDTRKMLKEQQERFATEINTIMEALQRVEGHAKGLTTSNLELRESLKAMEAEKLTWQRRYMSLQAKEESIVRQMEVAVKQRTEALQIHLRKGDTGALQQLMDQVRQHQIDLFSAQEQLRTKEEELSKSLAEKLMMEERIENFSYEMKDLRQAAGPTANLIHKLKSDVQEAQMNERKVREDFRLLQLEMRAKPKPKTETVLISTAVEPPNAAPPVPERQKSPTPTIVEVPITKTAATEDVMSLQKDLAQLHIVIDTFKAKMNEKEQKIQTQSGEIISRDELIKAYVETTSAQFDKIQAKGQELASALEGRDKLVARLKSEIATMQNRLNALKEIDGWDSAIDINAASDELLQQSSADELEAPLNRLILQNKSILQAFHQLLANGDEQRLASAILEQQVQMLLASAQAQAPASSTVEKKPDSTSLEQHTALAISGICKHFCNRAYQYYCEIARDVFDAETIPISKAEASTLVHQAVDQMTGKRSFDKILNSLVHFVKEKMAVMGNLVASINENAALATALSTEKATVNFNQLVQASKIATKIADTQKIVISRGAGPTEKLKLKSMQERFEEQKKKWEVRKAKIKEEQAACIMRCLHSFMHVIKVNFKSILGSHTAHQASAFVYSSLLDDSTVLDTPKSVPKLQSLPQPPEASTAPRVIQTKEFTMPISGPDVHTAIFRPPKESNLPTDVPDVVRTATLQPPKEFTLPLGGPDVHASTPFARTRDAAVSYSTYSGGSLTSREPATKHFLPDTPAAVRQSQSARGSRPMSKKDLFQAAGPSIGVLGMPFGNLASPPNQDLRRADGKPPVKYALRSGNTRPPATKRGEDLVVKLVSRGTLNVAGLLPVLPFL